MTKGGGGIQYFNNNNMRTKQTGYEFKSCVGGGGGGITEN